LVSAGIFVVLSVSELTWLVLGGGRVRGDLSGTIINTHGNNAIVHSRGRYDLRAHLGVLVVKNE